MRCYLHVSQKGCGYEYVGSDAFHKCFDQLASPLHEALRCERAAGCGRTHMNALISLRLSNYYCAHDVVTCEVNLEGRLHVYS
jgi:hypothetical protein